MTKRVERSAPETHGRSLCCKSRLTRLSDKRTARHNEALPGQRLRSSTNTKKEPKEDQRI